MAIDGYLRAYSFLFQVVDFGDVGLEALYLAGRALVTLRPIEGGGRLDLRGAGAVALASAALFPWTARGGPVGTLTVAWPAHGQRTRVRAAIRAQSAG